MEHRSPGAHFMHSCSIRGVPFWPQINCEQNRTETKCTGVHHHNHTPSNMKMSTFGFIWPRIGKGKKGSLRWLPSRISPKIGRLQDLGKQQFWVQNWVWAAGKTAVDGAWPQNQLTSSTDVWLLCTQLLNPVAIHTQHTYTHSHTLCL